MKSKYPNYPNPTYYYELIIDYNSFTYEKQKHKLKIKKDKNIFKQVKVEPIELIENFNKQRKHLDQSIKNKLDSKVKKAIEENKMKLKPNTNKVEYNKEDYFFKVEDIGKNVIDELDLFKLDTNIKSNKDQP